MTLDKMGCEASCYSSDQINENEMGGACMGKKCIKDIHREPEEMRPIGYLSVDGRMILK
jgi:hypothetical protein